MVLTPRHAAAQNLIQHVPVSQQCAELNQAALTLTSNGQFHEAELALVAALAGDNHLDDSCIGLMLNNLAATVTVAGKISEAEALAERSVNILEKIYPPEDPVLLRPLQVLAATRFEQGKTAKAREAFRRILLIRVVRPEDRSLVHGLAAVLLQGEHKLQEAESEYFAAISALEEAGRGESGDAAAFLNSLGSLYIEENRLGDAQRVLDHSLAIFTTVKETLPMDRIKVLNVRAVLHTRQGKWSEAEQDLSDAVKLADCEPKAAPLVCAPLLTNYAYVLRKNHHASEARAIDAQIAALGVRTPNMVVDVTELVPKPKRAKK